MASDLIEDLVAANRILADQGVLDAWGHVSVRHERDAEKYLLSRSLAPELVTEDDIMEYDLESNPIEARGCSTYLERFIHGEIYKARPDVKAIVHSHSPAVVPFGLIDVPLLLVYHMSAFLWEGVPISEIRNVAGMTDLMVRNKELGRALAQTLGSKGAALMRGHGVVVVAVTLPLAVARAIYTEINARIQTQAISLGGKVTYLEPEEGQKAAMLPFERGWELWKRKALGK